MNTVYASYTREQLLAEQSKLTEAYQALQSLQLQLNMARGKPSAEQLNLSNGLLDVVNSQSDFATEGCDDVRNYGVLEGLPEARRFFAELMGVKPENVIVGGNSSLNMMFEIIACGYAHGFGHHTPWRDLPKIKFLCPAPGYDRHFSICEYYDIEMITIPMTAQGPDMDMVESLVSSDPAIKGIWCVPKYSNPQGITYSAETVARFAALKPAAEDFKIFWDNAYLIHELTDTPDELVNIFPLCEENGTADMVIEFCSTSKMTFAGAGVAAMTASPETLRNYRDQLEKKTIGFDKVNQLRHMRFFGSVAGLKEHMKLHQQLLAPRFAAVLSAMEQELAPLQVAEWTSPKGGYFISVDVVPGCAKRVVALCKECGVVLTGAGATYPYKNDPQDHNIRLAPTYPPTEELEQAMKIFCVCVKLAAIEKALKQA